MAEMQTEQNKENLDPLLIAALVEDPDEDEEDKKLREKYFGDDADDDDTGDDTKPKNTGIPGTDDDTDEDAADDKNPKDPADPKDKKPTEAADDTDDDTEEELGEDGKPKVTPEAKPKTPTEQKSFAESIVKDGYKPRQNMSYDYNPLDYSSKTEFDPTELAADRDKFGAAQMAKGAAMASYWGEQDRFFNDLATEAKVLESDPKYKFMDDAAKEFDPDKAAEINESFLKMAGFKQVYKTDAKGEIQYNPQTKQPIVLNLVEHPEYSFEKYVKRYVNNMERWSSTKVEEEVEEIGKKIGSQKRKQGIRPGGGNRKSLGNIQLGDISNMSDEDFEKNEAEIDRQIAAML